MTWRVIADSPSVWEDAANVKLLCNAECEAFIADAVGHGHGRCCLPRHQTRVGPSFREVNGVPMT